MNRLLKLAQENSIPLLAGVAVALLAANISPDAYLHSLHWEPLGSVAIFGHPLTLHFIVNDLFMVFFFGIAAKEITESCLPGGSLNPVRRAITPLFATAGGVVGPVVVFFGGLWLLYQVGIYDLATDDSTLLLRGWGIPTATDIALAWLVARAVFGKGHPAIAFLLLLAVADDAIGLVIIAGFYGDPAVPFAPMFLLLVVAGIAVAYAMRRARLMSWIPYVLIAGPLAWSGLMLAHLHPALALALVVPLMPGPSRDTGLFALEDEVDKMGEVAAHDQHVVHSPLHQFEHYTKVYVDFGLFFFAYCNAGVQFASIGPMTWLILGALVIGKTVGVTLAALLAMRLGFSLPDGMSTRDLLMSGFIASLGLTVALFVATAAFVEPVLQGQAKMGALLSGLVGFAAVALGKALGFSTRPSEPTDHEEPSTTAADAAPLPTTPHSD
jgi:NhaA family Na+:H+ antiporter